MKTLFLVLLLAVSAFSNKVRLSDYATANDGQNDSPGLQRAINDLGKTGGGTLVIDAGEWNLNSPVTFVTYENLNNSFIIEGQKDSFIFPALPAGQALFTAGNQNQIVFKDLIVVGDPSKTFDLDKFIHASFVEQLRVTGCQFFGLKARASLIYVGNTDAVIKDALFLGLSSGDAVINAENFRGLSVTDSEFVDYGFLNGAYYSKTPLGNNAWIKAYSDAESARIDALAQRPLLLQNVRFDEGANFALDARGISYIEAKSVMDNLASVDGSAGFRLDNVGYAEIKMSKFGYTNNSRPAIRALNNTIVYIDGMSVGKGVFYGTRDSGSQAYFNLKACIGGCSFTTD
jgi:hypothetical protein